MKNINWREYQEVQLKELAKKIGDTTIGLAIIQVGNDSASNTYINMKKKAASKTGIKIFHECLNENVSEEEILKIIDLYNKSNKCHGLMIQLPLPKHLNKDKILNSILSSKDVDGLTNENFNNLVAKKNCFIPCTAKAVMEMLEALDVSLNDKKMTILGQSRLVGIPLYHLLLQKNIKVNVCNTKTEKYLKNKYIKEADILITATGAKVPFITKEMIKEGSIIIDVSTEYYEGTKKIHGDCFEDVKEKALYVSPVPGGVGPITVLELSKNTYEAYLKQQKR